MSEHLENRPRHVVVLCHSRAGKLQRIRCASLRQHGAGRWPDVIVRDLYGMGFHPVLKSVEQPSVGIAHLVDVDHDLEILRDTDAFVYPIWFGSAPAMPKGYVERALGSEVEPGAVRTDRRAAHSPESGC